MFANKDDSFEWFGGTVNARYLVSAFGNDDGFDVDQGFRGTLQFLFSIQTDITADRGDEGLELDGATAPLDATPRGRVTIANGTFIGIGPSGGSNTAAKPGSPMWMASPVGTNSHCPGCSTSGCATQARKSMPALPAVA